MRQALDDVLVLARFSRLAQPACRIARQHVSEQYCTDNSTSLPERAPRYEVLLEAFEAVDGLLLETRPVKVGLDQVVLVCGGGAGCRGLRVDRLLGELNKRSGHSHLSFLNIQN